MRAENKVSDEIIAKSVDIWCKKLFNPVFDNGDTSDKAFFGIALASINIENDKSKINNMEERVKVFRFELTKTLTDERDNNDYFKGYLGVDYGPCEELADAAEKADIPHSQFSCKSNVYINEKYVSASFGYGTRNINYFPLSDGRWLKTTLNGSDEEMKKIFEHALNGNQMEFEIE